MNAFPRKGSYQMRWANLLQVRLDHRYVRQFISLFCRLWNFRIGFIFYCYSFILVSNSSGSVAHTHRSQMASSTESKFQLLIPIVFFVFLHFDFYSVTEFPSWTWIFRCSRKYFSFIFYFFPLKLVSNSSGSVAHVHWSRMSHSTQSKFLSF